MRWFPAFILGYVALGLQLGLGPCLRYHGAAPNLVLLAVLFIALSAPREPALLGCFAMGILQDLVTQQQPGLYALSYGLFALFAVGAQNVVYRDHPLAHLSLALAGGIITTSLILLHGFIYPPSPRLADGRVPLPALRLAISTQLLGIAYTALLAPIVLALLNRSRRVFAFAPPSRRRIRGWT